MIGKLNHVGVATPSIEKSVEIYRDLLGATSIGEKFALPEQGVWVCFVDVPNSQIELIEPYGDNSPITAFLAKNPAGGQHHICFEVPDIIAARDDMVAKGATVLNNAVIPEDCIVGANALVTEGKTFEPGNLIVGAPARAVKTLDDKARAMLTVSAAHYVENGRAAASGLKRID